MVDNHNKKSRCSAGYLWHSTVSEWTMWVRGICGAKLNASVVFAIICVLVVIVGNVILLIALNFWLSIFPTDETATNSSQIAVQVIVCCFLVLCFSVVGVIFLALYGFKPLWHSLVDTNRVRGPLYRLFLLFGSGATNAITGVLGVYSMSYTPEFLQAVFLSVIPFCAQIWTYALVSEERKRRYMSLTLFGSFVFCVAGVLLSSMSSFIEGAGAGKAAPWNWALIYLSSTVVFGLWCVVQRLYLDAIMFRSLTHDEITPAGETSAGEIRDETRASLEREFQQGDNSNAPHGNNSCQVDFADNAESSMSEPLLVARRQWGKQNVDDLAAKTTLLLVGIIFQALVSFLCVPVDAIPWFGTSSSVSDAWIGFRKSCDFIFASWMNIRFGLLHTLGFFLSFVGCSYLNERSPTLASVVLQLAGPMTGVTLIIVPQWDVYGLHGIVGHKVGGVILLSIAGLFYHVWEQTSLREMIDAEKRRHEECGGVQQTSTEKIAEEVHVGKNKVQIE